MRKPQRVKLDQLMEVANQAGNENRVVGHQRIENAYILLDRRRP